MAYVNANIPVIAHKVIPLQSIVDLVGEEVRMYLQIVPGLTDLVQRSGSYVLSWVREFFATLWISPDHTGISFNFLGEHREISSARARELLWILLQTLCLHQLCYPAVDPPRHAQAELCHLSTLSGASLAVTLGRVLAGDLLICYHQFACSMLSSGGRSSLVRTLGTGHSTAVVASVTPCEGDSI
jgi:hypothetical protein